MNRTAQFAAFLAVILLITGGAWVITGSFIYNDIPGGWRSLFGAWLVSVAPLFVLIRNLAKGGYPSPLVRLVLFRLFWYSQFLALVLAVFASAGFILGAVFGAGVQVGQWAIYMLAPLLVLLGLWGYVGTRRLVVRRLEAFSPALPPGLEGLRIVQLSDLHVGPHTPTRHMARIADETARAQPHLIAYTGDQVDDYPRDTEVFQRAFEHLTPPLGAFAIPGNHDIYAGWDAVRRGLETMGVRVLLNQSVRVPHNGAEFYLAGTGDPAGRQMPRGGESAAPDIDRTMRDIPAGAFSVVLAHNPALWPTLAERGAHLTLSGHTHYGQLATRTWSLASVFVKLAMGWHEQNGSLLYISPGTNYWGIPFRVGALPEVTVLTLRRGAPARIVG
jgi:uncharacterized protein